MQLTARIFLLWATILNSSEKGHMPRRNTAYYGTCKTSRVALPLEANTVKIKALPSKTSGQWRSWGSGRFLLDVLVLSDLAAHAPPPLQRATGRLQFFSSTRKVRPRLDRPHQPTALRRCYFLFLVKIDHLFYLLHFSHFGGGHEGLQVGDPQQERAVSH